MVFDTVSPETDEFDTPAALRRNCNLPMRNEYPFKTTRGTPLA
jgi:hypothetical protein